MFLATTLTIDVLTKYKDGKRAMATGMVSVSLAGRRCTFNISGGRPRLLRGAGRFVTGVGSSKALSRVYGGCFSSKRPRTMGSTALSASGSRLIMTAGTTFRPFRCAGNSSCCKVSVRVTRLLTSRLNGRLMVRGVSFSTIYLSMDRRGYSVTVTKLAVGRRERKCIAFASSCCSTSRHLVIPDGIAAFSSYGATSSITTGLTRAGSSSRVNIRRKAANRCCVRKDRS